MGRPGNLFGVGSVADSAEKQNGDGEAQAEQTKKSSAGVFGGIAFVLIGTSVGIFFFLTSLKDGPTQTSFVDRKYAEIDLDSVQREMAPDSAIRFSESFQCQPVLILNPEIENLDEVKSLVLLRKKALRGDMLHLLYRMPESYFKKPNLMGRISTLFLDHINESLGSLENGKSIVSKVIFSQFDVPAN